MSMKVSRRALLAAAASSAGLTAMPSAWAQLQIEISGVGANQIPIALLPLNGTAASHVDVMSIVSADLARTGAFRLVPTVGEPTLQESVTPNLAIWQGQNAQALATGSIQRLADGSWDIRYRLFAIGNGQQLDALQQRATDAQLRMAAHRIADQIYKKLTGFDGLFTSRLAYVVEYSRTNYALIVADSDGANPVPALKSRMPIISPAWSPDGSLLAYVSFENQKPVVYLHTIATGRRRVVANFRGNNSAPAFSPDGRTLAVALSRDGGTQLFYIDIGSGSVRRATQSLGIDTEPVFSPDGQWIYFTSDRGSAPQIYRMPVNGGSAQRVTFNSNYAVSADVDNTGKQLTYITRVNGTFKVALMDLSNGQESIISHTQWDENPGFSPNGRIIVYATERAGRGVLATVSVDGRVSSWLSGPAGNIREPTWGPLLA